MSEGKYIGYDELGHEFIGDRCERCGLEVEEYWKGYGLYHGGKVYDNRDLRISLAGIEYVGLEWEKIREDLRCENLMVKDILE